MYASQWFLTLFTAKFPLCMVFHITDLLLCEVQFDCMFALREEDFVYIVQSQKRGRSTFQEDEGLRNKGYSR